MMKKILTVILGGMLVILAGSMVWAQDTPFNINVTVTNDTITVQKSDDLDFGLVAKPSTGSTTKIISPSDQRAATFDIHGAANAEVDVKVDQASYSNADGSITVDSFQCKAGETTLNCGGQAATFTTDSNGDLTVNVGATIEVTSNAAAQAHTISATLVVTYH